MFSIRPRRRVRNAICSLLQRLRHHRPASAGRTDADYDALFTKDKPIIFTFHGYPTLVHELTYERTNRNLSVHGYQEEGTITTPFDMRVQHEIDRFHLVKDALLHLPQLGNRGAYIIQQMNDKLVAHKKHPRDRPGYARNFGLEVASAGKQVRGLRQ